MKRYTAALILVLVVAIMIGCSKQAEKENTVTPSQPEQSNGEWELQIYYTNGNSDTLSFAAPNTWLSGNGAPNAETGIPGDFYFDIENLVRYQKKASGWSVLVDFNDSLTRKYNVEFKTNGGQFASSTFTGTTTIERGHCFYADGRQVPLVVRQGFIFDGWYTTKNPDPTIHGRFTDLTNVYSDRTLYANWIQDTASK